MNPRYRIYAAVGLAGVILLGGGFLVLGRGGSSSSAAVHEIKPLHPVNKTKKRAAHPATRKVKRTKAKVALAPPKAAKTHAATDGMPATLSAALKRNSVVVVALVVPGATVDDLAYQEAKAGAKEVGAGFVRISTANNDEVQALSTLIDSNSDAGNRLLDAPAVLVFRQPQELYVRFNGYIDADTIAQAIENAAPVTNVERVRSALASAWVPKVNAACTKLRSDLASESFPTRESQVLPFLRKLVDSVKETVDKIRALKPPKGKEQRVAAMLAAWDRMFKGVYAELDAAQKHQLFKIEALQSQVQRDGTLGDQIAAELGATSCTG